MSFPLNLKHLILKAAMHENELYGIRFFLNSCPYLETLTIEIGPGRVFDVSISKNWLITYFFFLGIILQIFSIYFGLF